jgi:hypothetical protein
MSHHFRIFRTPSAVFALLALIPGTPTTASAAEPAKYYGAFAYDVTHDLAVVDIGVTADEAATTAESTCRTRGGGASCQSVAWFTNSYASFATGDNGRWGVGFHRASIEEADRQALANCSGCHLVIRVGIGGRTANAGPVAPMREAEIMGFGRNVGDHIKRDEWAVDMFSELPEVYAARSGRVVFSGWNCDTVTDRPPCYGNTVAVDHGGGIYSTYAHLSATDLVALDTDVTPGTRIGTMSDSGCEACGGEHLHFAVHQGDPGLSGTDALFHGSLTAVRTPWGKP